jgi:urea transporter
MSLSFSVVSMLIWLFYMKISEMNLLPFAHHLWFSYEPALPKYVMQYFHSAGSIFFQPFFIPGLLIVIALFLISRIGFFLSLLGYTVGYLFIRQWGGMGGNDILYPGFNLILTSFAVGGIFLIPSRLSYLLAIIAAFLGLVFSFALQIVFVKYHVPPFALPFNLTVLTMIFALKLRLKNRHPRVNDIGILHPENALEYVLTRLDRFAHSGRPLFYLPFHGEWTITQGNHGSVTHKADWA